jgi:hypothetical protein
MIPDIDERLASIARSLEKVILPHLQPDASLAQEQVQLAIGHVQILRAQIDKAPDYEREELADYSALARALAGAISGGSQTGAALAAIDDALAAAGTSASEIRDQRKAVNNAIETLVRAVFADGDDGAGAKLAKLVLDHENARVQKDREWFAPFGFDSR